MAENVIHLVGNLGKDAVMRFTPAGTAVVNFSMATNKTYKDDNGVRQTITAWFRVTIWGKYGEALVPYLKKGKLVHVLGHLTPDKNTGGPRIYKRDDGTEGAQFEVKADTCDLLGGSGDGGSNYQNDDSYMDTGEDDGIPFN